jgi:hypothetical protein
MASKIYNDTLLRQAHQVKKVGGDLTEFARAKRISRSGLYTHLKAWEKARGL